MARRYRNETERKYFRERDRIRKALERMEQRGIFMRDQLSNKSALPKIPKKITAASVRRLEKITTASLYKRAELVSVETGEILAHGSRAAILNAERKYKRAQKTGQTFKGERRGPRVDTDQLIIDNLISDIRRMNSSLIEIFIVDIYEAKRIMGTRALANLIEANAAEFHEIIELGFGKYKPTDTQPLLVRFERLLRSAMWDMRGEWEESAQRKASKLKYGFHAKDYDDYIFDEDFDDE